MKKLVFWVWVLAVGAVFAKLTIPQTTFRKAPLDVVENYASNENAEAQLELALRYYAGHQVTADAQKAFEWMSRAAELKNQEALYLLSQMFEEGIGVPVNLQKAESLFISVLVAHPKDAQVQRRFEQWVQKKKSTGGTADEFLKKCSEAGYGPASLSLYAPMAISLYSNGHYEEALPLLRKLSNLGDAVSTLCLAKMSAEGLGGLPQDEVQARILYQQLADQGDATAQVELARMVENGVGGDADPRQAKSLYKLSAEQGNIDAKSRLAEVELARFPYVLRPIKELYPKSKVRQKIVSVEESSGAYQNIAGEIVPGLTVRYERPPTSVAAGFSGIVFVGVELANRKTGVRYWALNEYLDDGPTYEYSCNSDLDLFVDQELDSDVAITSWAVVYGSLLPDRRTVAVLDTREYKADSLMELFERNRDSRVLVNRIVAKTVPQTDMGGDLSSFEEDADGNTGILGTIGHVLDILYPLN